MAEWLRRQTRIAVLLASTSVGFARTGSNPVAVDELFGLFWSEFNGPGVAGQKEEDDRVSWSSKSLCNRSSLGIHPQCLV